ncbi:hypothetical protein [Yinghuangia seranimata]|uniref:hypothetical protein n=1 Tax=Yinghuangia seranimata TaxID=408067 RepID=UPI00248B59F7|nr:hypothetical protein [Yinghuangia seranimata]MDI2130542.1 hypothetical protein [Yinghuangia seranimata]
MNSFVAELLALMPPLGGSPERVEWEPVDVTTGKRLPDDYLDFLAHYGPGSIERFLGVAVPDAMPDPGRVSGWTSEETANARGAWEDNGGPAEVDDATEESVVAWGADGFADIYCWITSGEDPNAWPVLVWRDTYLDWCLYPMGMAEFLLKTLRAELPDDRLNELRIWGKSNPRYISYKESSRLRVLGVNAWTGEPM